MFIGLGPCRIEKTLKEESQCFALNCMEILQEIIKFYKKMMILIINKYTVVQYPKEAQYHLERRVEIVLVESSIRDGPNPEDSFILPNLKEQNSSLFHFRELHASIIRPGI